MINIGAPPPERRGTVATGRISKLMFGQGHGYIRVNGREVYFHRADLHESVSFNDLAVDDAVTFELLDDAVSGARALQVKRKSQR